MNSGDDKAQIAALQREVRALKRKLTLTEINLDRARIIFEAQNRVEEIMVDALKKEVQFFKLILENATNILLLLDFDGRFAYASDSFLKSAGIANFGLVNGRHYTDVLRPILSEESLARFVSGVDVAVSEKRTVTLEDEMDLTNRRMPRTYSIHVTPMTDEEGKNTGIMALFNDITEINRALEMANRASHAKSEFLANMSHEIRTPLNAIIGMAAIAEKSDDMEKIQYCLGKINDSSTHLLGVINDILDMSKIETNHFELSYSEFVFEKMLLRIVDVMRFKIEEKDIAFTLTCDPDIPYAILSDEQRLAQVVMNLLSNAVKFTPKQGSVSIRAEVESRIGDEYTLRIAVSDTGIGIAEEQRPRLFKAFSQADNSISRKFGGTGLGLIISKNITNLMGGDIVFDSQVGKGTTFVITFKTKAVKLQPAFKVRREHVKVLVVDDMPDVLLGFSTYAKKLGVACTTALSAEDALPILEKEHYHIVFVDWRMPGMDGLTFAKRLKEQGDDQMVVIMISAADWSQIESEAKAAGVREFISKPVLLPIIESVLDKYCGVIDEKPMEAVEDFSGKTMLLTDDIEINREIIISLLENTDLHIDCAENGREALEIFKENPDKYDIIFMDVQMPEMDGYEATRHIRALGMGRAAHVPILAMTANVFKEDVERCLASGMNDHIGKPINPLEILAKIRQWLG